MKRKPKIVKRVDVRATLLSIKIGERPEFTEFQMSSNNASSIATNLKKEGKAEFKFETISETRYGIIRLK